MQVQVQVPATARPAQVQAPAPSPPALAVTTVRPLPAYAQKGAVGLPVRGFALSEEGKAAARDAVAAARAGLLRRPAAARPVVAAQQPEASRDRAAVPERGASPTAPSVAVPVAPSVAAPVAAPFTEAPVRPTYAISTRVLRTRAEAEQLQTAITALLRMPGTATRRVELLPEGEDWRVVAWPFLSQADADRLRALLAGRGMKVEVVRF